MFSPTFAASFDRSTPWSDDRIRKAAPSVFAEEAHDSRSERYAYIATAKLLAGLRREGFEVFDARQSRTRLDDRRDFTKHMLRLRHMSRAGQVVNVGDSVPEVVLINSHDGSSSYQMSAGMYRKVCSNGLMVCQSTMGDIRVPHTGQVQDRVISGAFDILDGFTRVVESRDAMQAVRLSDDEQRVFASSALLLKYDDEQAAPIDAGQLLRVKRVEDRAPDLWTTFNRVQEHMVRGGDRGRTATGKRTSTRAVEGIDQSVKLNRALWSLAEQMRALKA